MKKLLIASAAALALSASSAFAADLAPVPYYKAPPPLPPPVSWTGCYIDGGAGYGMWNQDQYDFVSTPPGTVPASNSYTIGGRGWLGRVGVGCDYQVAPRWVIGVFGDYDFMNVRGRFDPGDFALDGNENESGAWYVGGRIGYLVTPALLTYFDGGYTRTHFGQINLGGQTAPFTPNIDSIAANNYGGWFLGGGTEYALNFDWLPIRGLFWRNEYRFAQYDAANLPVIVTATGLSTGNSENIHPYVQTVTTSLVWRFNWGGPLGEPRE